MIPKIRICHIIGSLQYGGAERQFVHLMNNMIPNSKYAIFIGKHLNKGFYSLLSKDIKYKHIPIRIFWAPFQIFKIARFLKKYRITFLQTHMYWANFYGSIAGKIANVPVIITTEHGRNPWKNMLHYYLERNIITKLVDMRVCVSQDILKVRKQNDKIPNKKLTYIPNCVELPEKFVKTKNKIFTIGSIGRFVAAKDYSTLLKTFAILKKRNIKFESYIVGDGFLRSQIEDERNVLGLKSMVKITGFQKNIPKWLKKFDLFVISSIREGQPVVILEAMAYRLPIVATSVGGIPDTIRNNKEGILVESGNPEAIANAIQFLFNNEKVRIELGKNAYKRIIEDFSIKDICQKYIKIYFDIIERKLLV